MPTINPHINYNGNAEEAFHFYQSVFGGTIGTITRFKDIATAEYPVAPEDAEKIMLITLPIGPSMLMANDVPASMGTTNEHENRSKVFVAADSREEAAHIFQDLSAGGTVEVAPDENGADAYFAMFRDKYGVEWMVEFKPHN